MTIQQLEYFLAAARSLNFTRTAEAYYISQSAITQQIRNLENELGVTLFSRKNRKLMLTDAGELFVSEAESLIHKLTDSIERVRAVQDSMVGTLRIGYLKCMEMSRFPKSIQTFHNNYPSVKLLLRRDSAISLHDAFVKGDYDLIFNIKNDLLTYQGFASRRLGEYRFLVVLPPGHPLTRRKIIRQNDLEYENLIIHDFTRNFPRSPGIMHPNYLDTALLSNVIRTDEDVETILIMVASGIGIAILPDFEIRRPQVNLNLIYVPLDTNGYKAILEVIYEDKTENPLIPLFLDEV
ncbi:MAG: LysR family transcriptional regulator [Lachnospiraceae bacterium]|nr:LysR family transcriptional regulator [Lachnospiraceae bacterium]